MTPLEYRMHTEDSHQLVLALQRREVLAVQVGAGLRLACLEGRLWITQHRHAEDLVLEAGDAVELSRKGQAVVQALGAARFALTARVSEREQLRRGSIDWGALGEPALRFAANSA